MHAHSSTDLLATNVGYYLAIVEHGSLTAAARVLGISQPSLSVALRKLEEHVGAQLLMRTREGVTPTRAGQVLVDHARQAGRTLALAREEISALDAEPRGRFVLGCHESLAAYALPGFMSRFLTKYQRLELVLWNGNSRDVEQAVLERRIDLGLVVNPAEHPDSVVVKLFDDAVSFVANASLAADENTNVLFERYPLLHVPALRQTQALLADLQKKQIVVGRPLACSSMELVKSLVLDGVGAGILPLRVANHGVSGGKLVVLGGATLPSYPDRIALVRRFDLPQSAGARVLISELRDHAARLPPLAQLISDRFRARKK